MPGTSEQPSAKSGQIGRGARFLLAGLVTAASCFIIWLRVKIAPGDPGYQESLLPSRFVWATHGFWFLGVSFTMLVTAISALLVRNSRVFAGLLCGAFGVLVFQFMAIIQSMSHLMVSFPQH
jgi:hypothetical protein